MSKDFELPRKVAVIFDEEELNAALNCAQAQSKFLNLVLEHEVFEVADEETIDSEIAVLEDLVKKLLEARENLQSL